MATRRELIEAVAARYRAAGRNEKKEILDEFVKVTGFHRKHAMRAEKVTAALDPVRLLSTHIRKYGDVL